MKDRDNPYYQEVLMTIYSDALRLKKIVNNLLHLSQANVESSVQNHVQIRLDEMVLDVIENLSRTKGYNQIEVNLPEDSDFNLLVIGNEMLLAVAIGNLIENACKYSDGKPVQCILKRERTKLLLSVQDHGLGMSPEDLKFCMEPFYRSNNARTKEGFGIGMAVSDTILKSHGVGFQIESELGKGTKVKLSFDLV